MGIIISRLMAFIGVVDQYDEIDKRRHDYDYNFKSVYDKEFKQVLDERELRKQIRF